MPRNATFANALVGVVRVLLNNWLHVLQQAATKNVQSAEGCMQERPHCQHLWKVFPALMEGMTAVTTASLSTSVTHSRTQTLPLVTPPAESACCM
jgi:hypothetical protein